MAAVRVRRVRRRAAVPRPRGRRAHPLLRARIRARTAAPIWLERAFAFEIGPHQLRGRVDRVDRLPDGGYELIDYKTGDPKAAPQLAGDLQLALYRLGAREAWQLEAEAGSYWYVLEDEKVSGAERP